MLTHSLQVELFDQITARFPKKVDAIEALCEILNASRDPVYRRLRGDTLISPDELALLARHFNISIDQLIFGKTDTVVCQFNAFSQRVHNFSDYLENYQANLMRIRALPGAHLYYASAEIPVFSYFYFPELICFKLYVWGRTTWNLKFLHDLKFDFDLVSPHDLRVINSITEQYNAIESTELWSLVIVDNTLAQIEFHLNSGGFRDGKMALRLCDCLLEWSAHLKNMAISGRKMNPGRSSGEHHAPIHILHNEMVYTNNTILVKSETARIFYAALSNPDFITSFDEKLCDHMENWFTTIFSKSTNITLDSERSREWFFRGLNKKIEAVKKRIEVFLEAE